jgi:hypothetical protein
VPRAHYYNRNTLFYTLHLRHPLIDESIERGAEAEAGEGAFPVETGRAEVGTGSGPMRNTSIIPLYDNRIPVAGFRKAETGRGANPPF